MNNSCFINDDAIINVVLSFYIIDADFEFALRARKREQITPGIYDYSFSAPET